MAREATLHWEHLRGNSIGKYSKNIPSKLWDLVTTEDNSADIASRDATASQLYENKLSWTGPNSLESDRAHWLQYKPTNEETKAERD